MSNEEFTQGEWFAVISEPLEDDFCCDVYDKNKLCICSCFNSQKYNFETKKWEGITEAQKEANMHLIAAAPDMYRMLGKIIEFQKDNFWDGIKTHLGLIDLAKQIDAILKKARGEE